MTQRTVTKDKDTSHDLAIMISELALEKKAENVVVMDVKEIAGFTNYFVIASGNSDIHLKTLADYIEDELSQYKVKVWHKEGYENLKWVLMDYVDVVVHLFDVFRFYQVVVFYFWNQYVFTASLLETL